VKKAKTQDYNEVSKPSFSFVKIFLKVKIKIQLVSEKCKLVLIKKCKIERCGVVSGVVFVFVWRVE